MSKEIGASAGMSSMFQDEFQAEVRERQIFSDSSISDALSVWREAGADSALPLIVLNREGGPEAEIFFAPPDAAHQMEAARDVQQRLLPAAVPSVPGFEFAGRYLPAGDVGGDYWSVKYYRQEGIVTCKLADVTGHGMAAAILMAAVKFVSGVLFRYSPSPAAVMERTNHSLLRETAPEKMATMVYAWVYPETRRVRLVNAGHSPAFWCRAANGGIEDIPATGPLLGLIETTYDEIEAAFAPGDVLFFCSDGVAEAGDPAVFNEAIVKDIVAAHCHESADQIADAVFWAARACCGPVRDDMSLLVIKCLPDSAPAETS